MHSLYCTQTMADSTSTTDVSLLLTYILQCFSNIIFHTLDDGTNFNTGSKRNQKMIFREQIKKPFDALLKSEFLELEQKALTSASKKKEHGDYTWYKAIS